MIRRLDVPRTVGNRIDRESFLGRIGRFEGACRNKRRF
jgi:hypothetical protein